MPFATEKKLVDAVCDYLAKSDRFPGPDDVTVNGAVCPEMPLDDFIAAMLRARDGGKLEFEAREWKGRTRLRNFSSGKVGGVLDANLSSLISKI